MTLDEYLKANEMTMQAFADEVGVHVSTVHRVKYAKIMPSRKLVEAIFKVTDGQVKPADLIEITGEQMKLFLSAALLAAFTLVSQATYANNPLYPVWSLKAITNPMTDEFEFLRYSSISNSNRENLLLACDGEDKSLKAFWQIATGGEGFPHSINNLPVKYRVDKRSPISATWDIGNPRVLLLPSNVNNFLETLKGGKKFVIQTDYTDPVSFDIKGIDTVISEIKKACR